MKELLIIKTDNSQKIKTLLDENNADYEIVYKDTVGFTEEEIWRRDILLANKDKARDEEITEWKKISKVKDKQGW